MNTDEQGVHYKTRGLIFPVKRLLLPLLLCLLFLAGTGLSVAAPDRQSTAKEETQKHHIYVSYSLESNLHSNIINALENEFSDANTEFEIIKLTSDEKTTTMDSQNDIIVSLGDEGMITLERNYPDTNTLFIASTPSALTQTAIEKTNSAILYMSQSYCRQLGLIRTINKNWNTIGILISQEKKINKTNLNKCTKKHNLKLYIVEQSSDVPLSRGIKDVLSHSDTLLALPDKNIYNRKTVKNILLTSYRFRKPVIAFSSNFVKAGALASIHSSPEQIAKSAKNIISNYFKTKHKFENIINYPQHFDVSINSQVFSALDIPEPDLNTIKQNLVHIDPNKPGLTK